MNCYINLAFFFHHFFLFVILPGLSHRHMLGAERMSVDGKIYRRQVFARHCSIRLLLVQIDGTSLAAIPNLCTRQKLAR